MRRHAAALLATVAACSAYHSASPPAIGAAGGACYPNGTCNAGLVCASDVCSPPSTPPGTPPPPGAPPPPGSEGGNPPSGADGGNEGGEGGPVACAPDPPAPVGTIPCMLDNCAGSLPACCGTGPSDLACHAKTDSVCQSTNFHYECLSSAQCNDATHPYCCAFLAIAVDASCPKQGALNGSLCTNDPTCGSLRRLCDATNSMCPMGTSCQGVTASVPSPSGKTTVGVCL